MMVVALRALPPGNTPTATLLADAAKGNARRA